ncbi:MAG: hypothetical protein ACLU30_10605 [Odoribacter splanchnicus]
MLNLYGQAGCRYPFEEDAPDKLYAKPSVRRRRTVKTVIVHGHTNIILVEKDRKAVYRKDFTPVAAEKAIVLN